MSSSNRRRRPARARPSRSSEPLPCPTCIIATASNSRVAKDRSWFGDDYRPISSPLGPGLTGGPGAPVIGIGTVLLSLKAKPNPSHRGHNTIALQNVLHVPSSICNIIGLPQSSDITIMFHSSPGSNGSLVRGDGTEVGYFEPGVNCRFQLRLSGPPVGPRVGPSPFDPNVSYIINARWPVEQREHWLNGSTDVAHAPPGPSNSAQQPARPNEQEKQWLKRNFGGEFQFLVRHGLSIFKDEDREEAWQIMRTLMHNDDDHDMGADMNADSAVHVPITQEDMDGCGLDDEEREMQLLDSYFEPEVLQWVQDNHDDVKSFMLNVDLNVNIPNDREAAAVLAEHLMETQKVDEEEEDDDDEGDGSDIDWDEDAPEKLLCNSYFAPAELRWIQGRYGEAMSFMFFLGLKFYELDDGAEAARIARCMMADDPATATSSRL